MRLLRASPSQWHLPRLCEEPQATKQSQRLPPATLRSRLKADARKDGGGLPPATLRSRLRLFRWLAMTMMRIYADTLLCHSELCAASGEPRSRREESRWVFEIASSLTLLAKTNGEILHFVQDDKFQSYEVQLRKDLSLRGGRRPTKQSRFAMTGCSVRKDISAFIRF